MELITHKDLVELAYKWVLKRSGCGVAFKELHTACCNGEFPDVIGFGSGTSTVVECKISRADFLADAKKSFRKYPEMGMGQFRYYCCPEGLINPEDLPQKWGLIYVKDGKCKVIVNPKTVKLLADGHHGYIGAHHERNIRAENELMYSALRRLFIKGYMKHIYDKDYSSTANTEELIALNEFL